MVLGLVISQLLRSKSFNLQSDFSIDKGSILSPRIFH